MVTATNPQWLGDALVSFFIGGAFPEAAADLPPVSETDLQPAIEALAKTKSKLEAEIHTINQETMNDVNSWMSNAKTLQDDVIRSEALADDIVRQAKTPQVTGAVIQDSEAKVEFLRHETQYSQQLHATLRKLQHVSRLLGQVEKAKDEGRLRDSFQMLEQSLEALDQVDVSKSCRVVRLLDMRSTELKSSIHGMLHIAWRQLIHIDMNTSKMVIHSIINDDFTCLNDVIQGLKTYKEVDERMEQLWCSLDKAILSPRLQNSTPTSPAVKVDADEIALVGEVETSIDALISDLDKVVVFLARKLPPELVQSLSTIMMGKLTPRILEQWLNPSIPSSLTGIDGFDKTIGRVNNFCASLTDHGFVNFNELRDWAARVPYLWLDRRRETALDMVRKRLIKGIGKSKQVERIEKHVMSPSESTESTTMNVSAATDTNDWGEDWAAAWDENDDGDQEDSRSTKRQRGDRAGGASVEDDGLDAWPWSEEKAPEQPVEKAKATGDDENKDDDDSAEAWGWGNEEAGGAEETPTEKRQQQGRRKQELVHKETYHISSMPEPILDLIFTVLEDGAMLTKENNEYCLMAPVAPGLLGVPKHALALFRTLSPHYYAQDTGGNMFLYNDAMYMAERLVEFSCAWKQRDDVKDRVVDSMLRLDSDIRTMQSFAKRSYSNEMSVQETALQELLGGSQSVVEQDDMEAMVESATARVQDLAATWEKILARSVWSQAVGSLVDALAARLISDVFDMASIGQEEAYNIAKVIASATELDELFLPSRLGCEAASADEVPMTAQYAPHWLRLKYLSEVLQSNLKEVQFLWCDSELSLYFSVDEVVDLVEASFADNARRRETIREIRNRPRPLALSR